MTLNDFVKTFTQNHSNYDHMAIRRKSGKSWKMGTGNTWCDNILAYPQATREEFSYNKDYNKGECEVLGIEILYEYNESSNIREGILCAIIE